MLRGYAFADLSAFVFTRLEARAVSRMYRSAMILHDHNCGFISPCNVEEISCNPQYRDTVLDPTITGPRI